MRKGKDAERKGEDVEGGQLGREEERGCGRRPARRKEGRKGEDMEGSPQGGSNGGRKRMCKEAC